MRRFVVAVAFAVLTCAGMARAAGSADSVARSVVDSVHVPAKADTADDDVDSIITYQAADTMLYRVGSRSMRLVGKAQAHSSGQTLNAEVMEIDFVSSMLSAEGRSDSGATSALGTPVFDDHGEMYKGNTLTYNFKTRRGNIAMTSTKMDNGYYYADKVYRETDNTYFIENGRYTTCDDPHPHYYFASPRMKATLKQEVLAAPVYLYVADVPLFAVPFGLFPNHSGRQSGLIPPAYGQTTERGFFLQHLGYFLAPNDYFDVAATTDLYTKGSAVFNGSARYRLRYDFDGSVAASFARTRGLPDAPISTQWSLQVHHNQTFDPQTALNANLRFMSSSFLQTTSNSQTDLLARTIQSDASFSRTWDGASMNAQYERTQDLQTNEISENPAVNFNIQQWYPFRSSSTSAGSEAWYELFGLAYGGSAKATHHVRDDSVHLNDFHSAVVHSPTFSFTPKFGDFSVSPYFNYSEVWYPERVRQGINPGDTVASDHVTKGFNRVWWYSMGASISTRLYGLVQPRVFGVTAFRHTLAPSLTFNYHPDFADPSYGFYGTYADRTGRAVRYSYFDREIAGTAPAGKEESINLSLGNTFEMKIADTDTSEQRIQLLNATVGASYNVAADSFRLSDINVSARTNILGALDLSGGASFSPYHYDAAANRRIDRFKWSARDGLLDMTAVNFTASANIALMQQAASHGDSAKPAPAPTPRERAIESDDAAWSRFLGEDGAGSTPLRMPLTLGLTYSFSQTQSTPLHIDGRTSNMSANLRMQITPTWTVSAGGYYDFVRRELSAPSVNVTKDLHCWEMNFIWYPTGQYLQGFSLEIRLKAPQLRDIKITKRDNINGLF